MKLNEHDLIGLRRLADDAQLEGKFDDAETLRELLDSQEAVAKVGGVETIDETVEKAGTADDLEESLEEVMQALECAADEIGPEAENFDDVQISLDVEVDRLNELHTEIVGLSIVQGDARVAAARAKVAETIAGLKDVVATLRGQRDRLQTIEKTARDALKEAGR